MKWARQGGQRKEGISTERWEDAVAVGQDSRIITKSKLRGRQAQELFTVPEERGFFRQQSRRDWLNYNLRPQQQSKNLRRKRQFGGKEGVWKKQKFIKSLYQHGKESKKLEWNQKTEQVRGKWEIDQKIMSPGYIQMKSIFVKSFRNVHNVHNIRLLWFYELESQKGSYYWKLLFHTWCLCKQKYLHTNQLFGDSVRDFHTQSKIWLSKYVPVNKTEKMEKTCSGNKNLRNFRFCRWLSQLTSLKEAWSLILA